MRYPHIIIALFVGAGGCLFNLIGMATPGWLVLPGIQSIGLFLSCTDTCDLMSTDGSLMATRTFVVIAFMMSLAGSVVCLVYYIKHIRRDTFDPKQTLIIAVLFIVAAITALLGVIIFATRSDVSYLRLHSYNFGYSFALTIVGGIFCGAAGALAFVHRMNAQSLPS